MSLFPLFRFASNEDREDFTHLLFFRVTMRMVRCTRFRHQSLLFSLLSLSVFYFPSIRWHYVSSFISSVFFLFSRKKKNCLLLSIQLSIWFWRKKIFPSFKNIFPSTIKRNTCLLLGRFYMDFLFHKAEESSFNLLSYIKLASIPASMSIIPFLEIRDCLSQKYNFYDYERLPFFFLPFSFFLNFFFFLFILLMWPFLEIVI